MRQTATAERIKRELGDIEISSAIDAALKAWFDADQDFNVWFLETTKGALDDAKLLGLVEGYGGDQDDVENAWDEYVKRRLEPPFTLALERSVSRMAALKLK